MQLYARDGQRAAALRQYRECVRQLDQELGVAPLPETTELYRAIEENRLTTDPSISSGQAGRRTTNDEREQVTPPHPSSQAERIIPHPYPLVGRARELETLLTAYSQITSSSSVSGQLLILQGEAGIGKTRLAKEFLAIVAQRGAIILTARSYAEQQTLAYAPFVQTLRAALNESQRERLATLSPPVLADAARLVPELAPNAQLAPLDGIGAQARFFDAIAQVIFALTHNSVPGVLFLDDAQWLDEASLDLLAYLVRCLRREPLCILLTWRTEEIANDHTLRHLYADALREERAQLISLARLAPSDVQLLVEVATQRGAPIDSTLATRLYHESEGQPFFLIESLKWIERAGNLPADDVFPASVRELLHSRLAHTTETARQLLSTAAVLGRSFAFEILDVVSGRSETETIAGLEELTWQGLLMETLHAGSPQYDITHEKLRALIYQETSLARRRLLHRRAADALIQQAHVNLEAVAGNIAHHYRAGGDEARAAEFYTRAGDYARSVFANRDAIENYTAALALGFPDAVALHTRIGDAQTLLGEYDAALASYETGAAFSASDADAKMARVYLRRGEWERAARQLQDALNAKPDLVTQAQLYADLALAQHQLQHDALALKHAQRALKLSQKAKPESARGLAQAQARNILGILARARGEWGTAHKHLEASRALAEKRNDVGAHAAALNNLALVAHATHDNTLALELAQRALELVIRAGDRHRQAALHNHLADLYHTLGRDGDSMEQLKRAVAIYAEIGGPVGEWQPEIWKLQEW